MPTNFARIKDTTDADGYVVDGYSRWDCERCDAEVRRYRGQSDVDCGCGACYNASGQRLRGDWRGNSSNYDDDVSDMEGYERQHAGDDW